MHVRYSSERPKSSNETKMIILAALNHLCIHCPEPSFERLRAVRQHMDKLTTIVQTSTSWGAGCEQLPAPVDPEVPSDSSLSSPGESSTESDDSSQQATEAQLSLEALPWLLPPKGMVHIARRQGELVALCSRREFRKSMVQGTGAGRALLTTKPWCPQGILKTEPPTAEAITALRKPDD